MVGKNRCATFLFSFGQALSSGGRILLGAPQPRKNHGFRFYPNGVKTGNG